MRSQANRTDLLKPIAGPAIDGFGYNIYQRSEIKKLLAEDRTFKSERWLLARLLGMAILGPAIRASTRKLRAHVTMQAKGINMELPLQDLIPAMLCLLSSVCGAYRLIKSTALLNLILEMTQS